MLYVTQNQKIEKDLLKSNALENKQSKESAKVKLNKKLPIAFIQDMVS